MPKEKCQTITASRRRFSFFKVADRYNPGCIFYVYSPHMGMGIPWLAFFHIVLTIVLPASLDHMRLDICVAFPQKTNISNVMWLSGLQMLRKGGYEDVSDAITIYIYSSEVSNFVIQVGQ
ncbi:unnamed protein product [Musa textilis]